MAVTSTICTRVLDHASYIYAQPNQAQVSSGSADDNNDIIYVSISVYSVYLLGSRPSTDRVYER